MPASICLGFATLLDFWHRHLPYSVPPDSLTPPEFSGKEESGMEGKEKEEEYKQKH